MNVARMSGVVMLAASLWAITAVPTALAGNGQPTLTRLGNSLFSKGSCASARDLKKEFPINRAACVAKQATSVSQCKGIWEDENPDKLYSHPDAERMMCFAHAYHAAQPYSLRAKTACKQVQSIAVQYKGDYFEACCNAIGLDRQCAEKLLTPEEASARKLLEGSGGWMPEYVQYLEAEDTAGWAAMSWVARLAAVKQARADNDRAHDEMMARLEARIPEGDKDATYYYKLARYDDLSKWLELTMEEREAEILRRFEADQPAQPVPEPALSKAELDAQAKLRGADFEVLRKVTQDNKGKWATMSWVERLKAYEAEEDSASVSSSSDDELSSEEQRAKDELDDYPYFTSLVQDALNDDWDDMSWVERLEIVEDTIDRWDELDETVFDDIEDALGGESVFVSYYSEVRTQVFTSLKTVDFNGIESIFEVLEERFEQVILEEFQEDVDSGSVVSPTPVDPCEATPSPYWSVSSGVHTLTDEGLALAKSIEPPGVV